MVVCGQLQAQATLPPGKEPKVPTEYEVGWAQEPACILWKREKSLDPAGIQTIPWLTSPQLVTILSTVF